MMPGGMIVGVMAGGAMIRYVVARSMMTLGRTRRVGIT
jgi:hypothetical protein